MPGSQLAYLDTSAFVKLVFAEPETPALIAALLDTERLVASEILEVEALRAVRRGGGSTEIARVQLDGVRLLPLDMGIRARASELEPPALRSLDAIHLATALSVSDRLDCLYTYDQRMAEAAQGVRLEVQAPA